jgi:hypothetical protein
MNGQNEDSQSSFRKSLPSTNDGLLAMYRRVKCRLFCLTHGLQPVAEVYAAQQLPGMAMTTVRLACGCDRLSGLNVRKPVEV